jgi:hypothetical protein
LLPVKPDNWPLPDERWPILFERARVARAIELAEDPGRRDRHLYAYISGLFQLILKEHCRSLASKDVAIDDAGQTLSEIGPVP